MSRNGEALRDMDAERFRFLSKKQLWGDGGVNKVTALEGRTARGAVALPQNVLGHGAAPQISPRRRGRTRCLNSKRTLVLYLGSFKFGGRSSYGLP